MKRILIALIVAFIFCSLVLAQKKTTILRDSIGKASVTVSSADTDPDSAYEVEFIDTPDDNRVASQDPDDYSDNRNDNRGSLFDRVSDAAISGGIAIITVTFGIIFAFPLFIIFIAFYFRYKNRRERYKLVEQALAAGQPLPEGIFKESLNLDTRNKGIKNICLGIGLFIFLWAITDSFGVGTIGLLVMFTGIGQYLVARNQNPTDEQR